MWEKSDNYAKYVTSLQKTEQTQTVTGTYSTPFPLAHLSKLLFASNASFDFDINMLILVEISLDMSAA